MTKILGNYLQLKIAYFMCLTLKRIIKIMMNRKIRRIKGFSNVSEVFMMFWRVYI